MFAGRYVVQDRVGAGGMATVYRGLDTFLHRQVALKVLRAQFADDEEFVRRFRREARAAASLSHPNIVAVYDVGQEGADLYYMVQEFIDGRTLKERIAQEGALDPEEAVAILRQVLEALGNAHRAGVIHRDVKPQNVLLTKDGRAKVADFGIARAEIGGTLADDASIVGTAYYAAPEQTKGRPTDERSDIYSVGVMFFEMLCGHVPAEPATGPGLVGQLTEPPSKLGRLGADRARHFAAVVGRAMASAPEDRYASTDLFLTDVAALAAGKPPLLALGSVEEGPRASSGGGEVATPAASKGGERARRRSGPPKKVAPRRRAPRPWITLGILAVILAAVVGGGYYAFKHWMNVAVVTVPPIAGQSVPAYEAELTHLGLAYSPPVGVNSNTVPLNVVMQVTPPPGTQVKRNFTLQIQYSLGPQEVTVPDVVGLPQTQAISVLQGYGLTTAVSTVQTYSKTAPIGYVAATVPPAGAQVGQNQTVTLTLSEGPPPNSNLLPSYVGQPEAAVETALQQSNLTLGTVTKTAQKTGWPAGIVTATSPAEGTVIQPGETVNLTVSSGCVYSQTVSLTASSGTGAQQETVTVSDIGANTPARTLLNESVPAGQTFSVELCWTSPQGAVWTWLENGELKNAQDVGTGGGGGPSTSQSSTAATGTSSSSVSRSSSPGGAGGGSGVGAG